MPGYRAWWSKHTTCVTHAAPEGLLWQSLKAQTQLQKLFLPPGHTDLKKEKPEWCNRTIKPTSASTAWVLSLLNDSGRLKTQKLLVTSSHYHLCQHSGGRGSHKHHVECPGMPKNWNALVQIQDVVKAYDPPILSYGWKGGACEERRAEEMLFSLVECKLCVSKTQTSGILT